MSAKRDLQVALCRYTSDTIIYIERVREFCGKFSEWVNAREKDLKCMTDIKNKADKINLNISHVTQSEKKGKAFLEYTKSKVTQMTADSRRAKLEKELTGVLNDSLGGLKKLDSFLYAVEKLAVTSLHVFKNNQVLQLPTGLSFEHVQSVITAAQLICPLLLEFKRDAKGFFLPKLQNVEVLAHQLGRYIQTAEEICKWLKKSSFSDVWLKTMHTDVDLNVDLSEDTIKSMLYQIELLDEIRKDPNFRMIFLFQDVSCSHFIREFNKRHTKMLQFLKELEECAVELEKMSKGAKISSVAGSTVGAVGGVLSIVGLALIPVTAGVSLALTMSGVGLGILSGTNSAVTTGTEVGINRKYQNKANKAFESLMTNVQSLEDCLQKVTSQTISKVETNNMDVAIVKIAANAGAVGKGIDSIVDAASAVRVLKSKELLARAGKIVAQEGKSICTASRLASDIPDIGKAAVKGPLALSKSARAGFIAFNALFLGMDLFFICKDSISLAKGSETEVSQFIGARAALWSSEIDSWQKIHDALIEGIPKLERNKDILHTQFYPRGERCRSPQKKEENSELSVKVLSHPGHLSQRSLPSNLKKFRRFSWQNSELFTLN